LSQNACDTRWNLIPGSSVGAVFVCTDMFISRNEQQRIIYDDLCY